MSKQIWLILTPGGYLIGRFCGSYEAANEWCKNHYLVWRLELEGLSTNGLTVENICQSTIASE